MCEKPAKSSSPSANSGKISIFPSLPLAAEGCMGVTRGVL